MSEVIEFKRLLETTEKPEVESDLDAIAKKNIENKKRLEEDRKKANKGVIRSYRLKS